jgi:hypothetical protein
MLPNRDPTNRFARGIGLFSVIVADLVGYPLAGAAVGYGLWKKLGAPWVVLPIFGVAGLVLAFYRLYQVSKKDWND